jgi:hypothetical protein
MTQTSGAEFASPSAEHLQAAFLQILPRIRTHAEIAFRHLKCPAKRDDAVAEVVAFCWRWYSRLAEQGRDASEFVSTLATLAARHVRGGRKLCGQERSKDVLSPVAQKRHGFNVEALPHSTSRSRETLYGEPHGQDQADAFEERLRDNTVTPPPDQAAFRLDYPRWLSGLGERDRQIAEDMAMGESTLELARKYPISQGRISQLRREFHADWQRFHGESV